MRAKVLTPIILILSILLAVPVMAQTEDELVARFIRKTERKQKKKVGFIVFDGSYGKLANGSSYNNFARSTSPLISSSDGSSTAIDGIYRSKEFFLGFGMMTSPRTSVIIGANYWLKLGSSNTGTFNLSLTNPDDLVDHAGFDLKSEIQVYGMSTRFNYYLLNQPTRTGVLEKVALKLGLGGGYYFARWNIWEGYSGYNVSTSQPEVINGRLSGSSLGFTAGLSAEAPLGFGGLVFEASAKYHYLNFSKMKWYNSNNEETVVAAVNSSDRIDLDFSGPRAQFGFRRYFNW